MGGMVTDRSAGGLPTVPCAMRAQRAAAKVSWSALSISAAVSTTRILGVASGRSAQLPRWPPSAMAVSAARSISPPKPSGQIWTDAARARASSSASRFSPFACRLALSVPYSGLSLTSSLPSVSRKTTLGVALRPSSVSRETAWRIAAGKSVPGPMLAASRRVSRGTQSLSRWRPAASATVSGQTSRTAD